MASVYLDIRLQVDPPWLVELFQYADEHSSGLILAVDSNAHSTIFRPDQNPRGTEFEDFRHGLHVENVGEVPTFQTSLRQSHSDVTLTRNLPVAISGWRVDTSYNGSDHNTIHFDVGLGFELVPSSRPWHKADWTTFSNILSDTDFHIPSSMTTKKLDRLVVQLTSDIDRALDECCPMTTPYQRCLLYTSPSPRD